MVIMNIINKIKVGEKYYTTVYGYVTIFSINKKEKYPIHIKDNKGVSHFLTEEGYLYLKYNDQAECIIFPSKENRDWSTCNYPKFNINTLEPFDKVLVRDNNKHCWLACLYSHYEDYGDTRFFISNAIPWNQCIPYTEETKHLVGTTNMPDPYYITWQ